MHLCGVVCIYFYAPGLCTRGIKITSLNVYKKTHCNNVYRRKAREQGKHRWNASETLVYIPAQ